MNRLKRAALLLLALLIVAACGSDDKKKPDVVNHADQTRFKLGDPAPDFTLQTADGRAVSLADYRDEKPVLLFFHMAVG